MTMPDWLAQPTTKIPDWLSDPPERARRRDALPENKEVRALLFQQFETVTPRLLEMVCSGYTLDAAIKELPGLYPPLDPGAYVRWLKKKPDLYGMYLEAKEVRTEAWTGEMVKHALGEETPHELDRSKFIVETYKWLVSRENRKQYGDVKTVEMNTTISITAALEKAGQRLIEAQVIDDDDDIEVIDESEYKRISAPVEDVEE